MRPHQFLTVFTASGALLAACGQADSKSQPPAESSEAATVQAAPRSTPRIPAATPLAPDVAQQVAGTEQGPYRLSTTYAPSLNIVGIATGSDLEAAAALALRHNPAFEVQASSGGPSVDGIPGVSFGRSIFFRAPKESLLISGAGLPGREKVYAIHRYLNVGDAPLALPQFEADLRQRFGTYVYQPSAFATFAGYRRYWGWSETGQAVPPRGMNTGGMQIRRPDGVVNSWYLDNCLTMPTRASMSSRSYSFSGLRWPSPCSVQVGVHWSAPSDNEQLVNQYLISIYDPATIAQAQAELTRTVQSKQAQQQSDQLSDAQGRRAQF